MQFKAQDVLITAAHLSKLHKWVLNLASHRNSLAKKGRVVPKIRLHKKYKHKHEFFIKKILINFVLSKEIKIFL